MTDQVERIKWLQEHAEALDRNWETHHEACLNAIYGALGLKDGSVPEAVEVIARLRRQRGWSTQAPTVPGPYWHRAGPGALASVVLVYESLDGLLIMNGCANMGTASYGGLWHGPLLEPPHEENDAN